MKLVNLKLLVCLFILLSQSLITITNSTEMKLKRKKNKSKSDWASVLTKLETFKPLYQTFKTTSCNATFLYLVTLFTDLGMFDLVKNEISKNKNLTTIQKLKNLVSCFPCLGGAKISNKKTTAELLTEAKTNLDNGKIIGVYVQAGSVQNHFQIIFKSGNKIILLQSFQDLFDLYAWMQRGRIEIDWNSYATNFENMLADGKTNDQKRLNLYDFAITGDLTKDMIEGRTMKEKSDLWWTDNHLNKGLTLQLYSFTPNWSKIATENEIRELLQ